MRSEASVSTRARPFGNRRRGHRIGELDEGASGRTEAKTSLIRRTRVRSGLVRSGRPDTTAAAGCAQQVLQQALEIIGIALHHGRLRIARAQQAAEHRIEFDQHQPRRIDAALDQRFGHRAGAGPKLDHGARNVDDRHSAPWCARETVPDGVTAPIASGLSSQERMKRTSSSRRRPSVAGLSRALYVSRQW